MTPMPAIDRAEHLRSRQRFWIGLAFKALIPGTAATLFGLAFGENSQVILGICYVIVACSVVVGWLSILTGFAIGIRLFIRRQ